MLILESKSHLENSQSTIFTIHLLILAYML